MTTRGRGFTLLEVTASLGLAALVLLGARALLDALAAARTQLVREATRDDMLANGERLLRAIVAHASTGDDSTVRFSGDRSSARFASFCPVPAGWLEPCRVRLALGNVGDDATLTAWLRPDDSMRVWRHRGVAELRYLDEPAHAWVDAWGSSIALPAAVGIVTNVDTVILLVGRSGG